MTKPAPTDWMDSADVQRVAFHPRKEWGAAEDSGFSSLDIPVAEGVTVGARFYAAGRARAHDPVFPRQW